MKEPALGMIEFKSVARGVFCTDVMVKRAPVRILETHPVCPGKYVTIICGEVADVEESMKVGVEVGKDMVVADMFLPYVERGVIPAMAGVVKVESFGAVAIVETFSAAVCVRAADVAAKTAPVQLVEIRLANGLGGKGYFVMTGEQADVEESLSEARGYVKKEGMLADSQLIASPHPELIEKGLYW